MNTNAHNNTYRNACQQDQEQAEHEGQGQEEQKKDDGSCAPGAEKEGGRGGAGGTYRNPFI